MGSTRTRSSEADRGALPDNAPSSCNASGAVPLWEPGVLKELRRKITPALYCEVLGCELSHNFMDCPDYQPIKLLSKTTRAHVTGERPYGVHRPPDRKHELPHYCVLCHHSKSLKDHRKD